MKDLQLGLYPQPQTKGRWQQLAYLRGLREELACPQVGRRGFMQPHDAPGTVLSTGDVRETREVPAWGRGTQGTEILSDCKVKAE